MQLLFTTYAQPSIQFIREALTVRTLLAIAALFAILSIALVSSRVLASGTIACSGDKLVYPIYSKRGIPVRYETRCGEVHRGCTQRGKSAVYDCSPFMAPKGLL